MTCGACAARIERRLNALDGVRATVNYASERALLTVDEDVADAPSIDRLIDEVRRAGYTAHVERSLDGRAPAGGEQAGRPQGDTGDSPRREGRPRDDGGEGPDGHDRHDEREDRARMLGLRLAVCGILFLPLCDLSILFSLLPSLRFSRWQWLLVALAAPVVTWAAWPFHSAALRHLRHGSATMDTLVSLGIVAASAWSFYAMFWRDNRAPSGSIWFALARQPGGSLYFDVAAGVTTFLLAGRYLEARWRRRTGGALRALAAVGAKEAVVVDVTGAERRVAASSVATGDLIVVRPGETIAADGLVESGAASIDSSSMTGESVPVEVAAGDAVVGGTVALGGRLLVRATRVGAETQLAQMLRLVESAQNQKASVQRLADRIASVFVPTVIVLALLTLAGWLASGGGAERAFNASLSVLIVACPCALGLATPAALLVASGKGARLGIFFKGYRSLETSRQRRHGRPRQDGDPDRGADGCRGRRGGARLRHPRGTPSGCRRRASLRASGRPGDRGLPR